MNNLAWLFSFTAWILVALLQAPEYCHAQATAALPPAWGFSAIIKDNYGTTEWDNEGKIVRIGDIALEFFFKSAPVLKQKDSDTNSLLLDTALPKADQQISVVFVTPKATDGHARIPRFKPTIKGYEKKTTILSAKQFQDYEGEYSFMITLSPPKGFDMPSIEGINCFTEGTEHHIYGNVKLFGAQFVNESKEPLVFKVVGVKYVYVKGKGSVKLADGTTRKFRKD